MPDNAYKPAGYCPHCGYAIDPGVCPECGKNVAVGELDAVPYWITRRRMVKRAAGIAIVVGLLLGGVYLHRNPFWLPYVPTGVLLALQGGEDSHTMKELLRRLNSGALTQAQADRMLGNLLTFPDGLVVRSPHPAGIDVQLNLPVALRAGCNGWMMSAISTQAFVDGVSVPWVRDRMTGMAWGFGPGKDTHDSRIDPLSPGEHEITWKLALRIAPDFVSPPPPGAVLPTFSRSFTTHVRVENKPIGYFVLATADPAATAELRKCVWIAADGVRRVDGSVNAVASLMLQAPPVAVAAVLEVRPFGERQYRESTDIVCFKGSRWAYGGCSLSPEASLSVGARIDVRLVPDPVIAFHAGLTDYYGGVIEWRGLTLKEAKAVELPSVPIAGRFFQPTRMHATTAESE